MSKLAGDIVASDAEVLLNDDNGLVFKMGTGSNGD